MEFICTNSIFVSEDELNKMAEQVKRGIPAKVVVDGYIAYSNDFEYCISDTLDAFDYKITNEVRKRAKLL